MKVSPRVGPLIEQDAVACIEPAHLAVVHGGRASPPHRPSVDKTEWSPAAAPPGPNQRVPKLMPGRTAFLSRDEECGSLSSPAFRARLRFLPETDQLCRIRRVAVMQDHVGIVPMRILMTEFLFRDRHSAPRPFLDDDSMESAKSACNAMKSKKYDYLQTWAPVQGFGLNVGYSTGLQTCLPLLLLMFCSGTFDAGDLPNAAADVFNDQTHGKMLSPHSCACPRWSPSRPKVGSSWSRRATEPCCNAGQAAKACH